MHRLTSSLAVAAWALGASLTIGVWSAGTATAATQVTVDSASSTGGDCSQPGQCTLSAAMTRAGSMPGTSIVLPAGTFVVAAPLVVPTSGVTISGAGASTIVSGARSSRLFEASGGAVTIAHMSLTEGFSDQSGGGAVFATDTALALDDVIVSDNAASGDGGALGLVGGSLVVTSSTFERNYGQNGGAVSTANTAVSITSSSFSDNGASSSGGAAFISFPPTFTVSASTFSRNQAVTNGGAVSLEGVGDGGTVGVLDGSSLDGNSAAGLGGAVFVGTSPRSASAGLDVTNSTFTGNEADAGGALALSDPPVTIDGSTFRSNASEGSGGAIVSNTQLTVGGSTFEANTSGDSGGAIASSGILSIIASGFVENHAAGSGGAYLLIGELPTIAGTFSGNTADGAGPVAFWTGRIALSISGVAPDDIYAPLVQAASPPTTPTTVGPAATTVPAPVTTTPASAAVAATTIPVTPVGRSGQTDSPPAPNVPLGGALPSTGGNLAPALRLGALVVLIGLGLLAAGRRRTRRSTVGT